MSGQGSHKISKKELKSPDAFMKSANSLWDHVSHHKKGVLAGVIAMFTLGAIYAVYDFVSSQNEEKAQMSLFQAEKKMKEVKASFAPQASLNKADDKSMEKSAEKKEEKKASGVLEVDYGDVVKLYQDVLKNYSSTKTSVSAAMELADLYQEYKHYDEGVEVLKKVASNVKESNLLYSLIQFKIAHAYEAKGSCDLAIEAWRKVTQTKENSFLHPDAYLKMGICYENLKQNEKAEEVYSKLSKDYADSNAGKAAKKYLKLLQVSKQG